MSKNTVSLEVLMSDLWSDLTLLREGKIDTGQAKARAVLARTIIESRKLQLVESQMAANGTPYSRLIGTTRPGFSS